MKTVLALFAFSSLLFSAIFADESDRTDLMRQYEVSCHTITDINEHLPTLRKLASECSSVVEIGLRTMVSTWGVLQGLADSTASSHTYQGIDIEWPVPDTLERAMRLAKGCSINFQFIQANDMDIDIPSTDLLFIDSLHTYCHLTYELETFSSKVNKYIVMHDTSISNETIDDIGYTGNYSEYPPHYDRNKRGLWPAIVDFLENHPEWVLHERYFNNYGLTILMRVDPLS